mgnify:FL=1
MTKLEKVTAPGAKFQGFKRMSTGSKVALIILALIALSAIFAPLLAPHDPTAIDLKGQPPSGEFWFGTDNLGRDVFSRCLLYTSDAADE